MSPVSHSPDLTAGLNGKRNTALPFDPIGSRKTERPKFELNLNNDRVEQNSRAETSRAADEPRDRQERRDVSGAKSEDRAARETSAPRKQSDTPASGVQTEPSQTSAAKDPATNGTAEAPQAVDVPASANDTKSDVRAENSGAPVGETVAQSDTAENTPAETASSATTETAANKPAEQKSAGKESDGIVVPSGPVPSDDVVPPSDPAVAAQDASSSAKAQTSQADASSAQTGSEAQTGSDASTVNAQAQVTVDASTKGQPAKPETSQQPQANQVVDPKLSAIEQMTKKNTVDAQQEAPAGDDDTSFTLPVPWPRKAGADNVNGTQRAAAAAQAGQTQANTQAQGQSVAQNAAQPNTVPKKTTADALPQTAETRSGTQPTGPAPQAAAQAQAQVAQNRPKIEIETAQAKPVQTESAPVIANQRSAADAPPAKPNAVPSPSETIAAVTALNSRTPRSNALGKSGQQSNALSAGTENGNAQSAAGANNPANANGGAASTPQPQQIATAAANGTTPQPLPVQEAAARAGDRAAATRPLAANSSETASQSTGTARAADGSTPSTSFADSLRSTGTERSSETAAARQSLPGAATEQVKVKLVRAAQNGLNKLQIQLRPSELGKVDVRLEIGSDGAIRGVVIAEKPETVELLQRDARQLERALQDAGFKTAGDSLSFELRGGQGNENYRQHAGAGSEAGSNTGGESDTDDAVADTAEANGTGVGDDGSLNLVA